MSIRVECSCGKSMQAENVFAGGQVKCACGRMVPVPLVDPKYVDKIRFHCPHCNMSVLGKRSSIGKKSKCPACGQAYVIPEPKPERDSDEDTSPAGFAQRKRISIDPTDIAFLAEVVPGLIDDEQPRREGESRRAGDESRRIPLEASSDLQVAQADIQSATRLSSPKSIRNPQSEIVAPQSAIHNPPSPLDDNAAFESIVQAEIDAANDSGISVTPVPVMEIRIDLTGGKERRGDPGTRPATSSVESGRREAEKTSEIGSPKSEIRNPQSESASRSEIRNPQSEIRNDSLPELERKTELPNDDDTIRTPTRPVPQLKSTTAARPRPSRNEGWDFEQIFAGFTNAPLPSPTIPVDELRLVDASPAAEDNIASTRTADRQSFAEKSTLPVAPLPRPLAKRALASPPVGGVSVYSPIARSMAQPGNPASLVFVDGDSAGEKIALRVRNFLIGRERDCHFRPKSASVSHHHCVLKTDDYSVRIRDLGSRNGTYVNGHRIHQEVVLHHSDSVWIGEVRFKVDIPHDLYAGYHTAEAQLSLDEFRIY